MAKSKSGGTRSYIRGKIGADVYSIGKNGKGQKQQVVRSLAEVVSNPQTEDQMRGRMIMSTVMQAVACLAPIIDHSFDNVPNGQPSISEFIRQNYALVKADVAAHPESGNSFGLNKYQEKGARGGKFVISGGEVVDGGGISLSSQSSIALMEVLLSSTNKTFGFLKERIGITNDDYMTIVAIGSNGGLRYCRFYPNAAVRDDTVIDGTNISTLFTQEGNEIFTLAIDTNKVTFSGDSMVTAFGYILSQKENGAWKHSKGTMQTTQEMTGWTAEVALPTYPQGSARFLNGGDI